MKNNLGTYFCVLILLAFMFSCKKENTQGLSLKVSRSEAGTTSYIIGQRYGGGIIFYINTSGKHGMIADTVDLRSGVWAAGSNYQTPIWYTKKTIGSGYENTRLIYSALGDSLKYAARFCWNYQGSGYTDWYLPSLNELKEIYNHKDLFSLSGTNFYWTSTEINSTIAWELNFATGEAHASGKWLVGNVRAIRSF